MRIAFLDSWLQQVSEGSGTAAAIGGLGRALQAQRHHVTRIAPLSPWPPSLPARRLLYNLQLPALLPRLPYDLVVGFDIDGFLYAPLRSDRPYVCSIKGVLAEELRNERGKVRRRLWLLSLLERFNARRAPLVLTTSDYARQKISEHYRVPEQRIRLVPEGIDAHGWRQRLDQIGMPRDPFAILCVARQYPRKRIADLLHAFVQVHRQMPLARLIVVGDGPEHIRLRRLADELDLTGSVLFTGALPDNNDVMIWYKRCSIFCLPSVQEGFGIVFLEAMLSGMPVVSTTAAAIPEVVPQRQVGILVPPASPLALAGALLELLQQPALCQSYGEAGRVHAQQFDWQRVADQFWRACSGLLNR